MDLLCYIVFAIFVMFFVIYFVHGLLSGLLEESERRPDYGIVFSLFVVLLLSVVGLVLCFYCLVYFGVMGL